MQKKSTQSVDCNSGVALIRLPAIPVFNGDSNNLEDVFDYARLMQGWAANAIADNKSLEHLEIIIDSTDSKHLSVLGENKSLNFISLTGRKKDIKEIFVLSKKTEEIRNNTVYIYKYLGLNITLKKSQCIRRISHVDRTLN